MRPYRNHWLPFVIAAFATANCSKHAPAPPDSSAALRAVVAGKPAAFVNEGGERGHQMWQEEQRFYKHAPDVYGLDRRHTAANAGQ